MPFDAASGDACVDEEQIHEWVADGFFLVHHWQASFGKRPFKSTRVLAYEPARADCFTRLLGRRDAGLGDQHAANVQDAAAETHSSRLPHANATVALIDAGASFEFAWTLRNNGSNWQPLCELLTRRVDAGAPKHAQCSAVHPSLMAVARDRIAALDADKPKPARLGWNASLRWGRALPSAVPCGR